MACPSQNYSGGQAGPASWTNWSGRFSGSVSTFWEPDTLADLVNVVRRASAEGHRLHVVGSGWAFENLAHSTDWMVSLRRLNKALSGMTNGALNTVWAANQAAGQVARFHVECRSIPQISGIQFGLQYQDSMGNGKRGPSHLILSGFREHRLQGCFRADSVEPIFDAHSTGYVDFLDAILAAAPGSKQAGYISLRWSATSRATLSMHAFPSAHAVAIEVTSLRGLPDNATWMASVEAAAVARGGRPHWGQINNLNAASPVTMFGGSVGAWRSALGSVVGRATTFSNAFTAQRALEPLAGATATVSGPRAGGLAVVPAISLLLREVPANYQRDWRWCHKCQGLFFGGNPGPVCPAGGPHEGPVAETTFSR